ncbi:unnamed protein product [Effrenium voratum]|uniref:Uncharacterized protein n=1 Tax=Effrenium voratum TaxID=2562239 RepID=A0AA36JJY6_9DINO|nr:unnamed protein product [Effrenium voratum]CAJ1417262.1 unnamed protein product [Effrenium voratum]
MSTSLRKHGGSISRICLTKQPDGGGFAYDVSSVVCFEEGLKLAILVLTERQAFRGCGGLRTAAVALLLALHGNLVFLAHAYLSPPMYQLLHHAKVVVTGVLFRAILQQQLVLIQWIALAQLCLALAGTSQINCSTGADRSHPDADWLPGVTVVLLLSVCSSLATALLRLGAASDGWLQLYRFLASLAAYAFLAQRAPLEGYTHTVFTLAGFDTALSFAGARIFSGGNAVKIGGTALTLLCAGLASFYCLDFTPGNGFLRAGLLSCCALCLYYGDQRTLYRPDSELLGPLPTCHFWEKQRDQDLPKMV